MPNRIKEFSEHIIGDPDEEIANYVEVEADDYFVRIVTDQFEGVAMINVTVAKKLIGALERAIKHVEAQPGWQNRKR